MRVRDRKGQFEQVALSVASAYDAFRDLSEELHDIDTRQYARESPAVEVLSCETDFLHET